MMIETIALAIAAASMLGVAVVFINFALKN